MTQLVEDYCHWCEGRVSRPSTDAPINPFLWIDEEESAVCLFHPANFDARTMTATGETAFHQTIEEVHDIVIEHHHRKKAIRAHEPLRAVEDNAVIVAKKAQRTSRKAAESVEPRTGTLRRQVFDFLNNRGLHGATDEEIETALAISGNTVRPSRGTLVDDGYVIDSGTTRKNRNGHDCIVWVAKQTDSLWSLETILGKRPL